MARSPIIFGIAALAAVAGIVAFYYYTYVQTATGIALSNDAQSGGGTANTGIEAAVTDIEAAIVGWKSTGRASDWLPALADAESRYGLPTDLLARIAYEESHFREDIIRGLKASTAGALGLMQLEPEYYASVIAPVPFTDDDVRAQIEDASKEMVHLFTRFSNWSFAIAAYNAGEGNVHKYSGIPPFAATKKYVADVLKDVPGLV